MQSVILRDYCTQSNAPGQLLQWTKGGMFVCGLQLCNVTLELCMEMSLYHVTTTPDFTNALQCPNHTYSLHHFKTLFTWSAQHVYKTTISAPLWSPRWPENPNWTLVGLQWTVWGRWDNGSWGCELPNCISMSPAESSRLRWR